MPVPDIGVFLPTLPPARDEEMGDVVAAARHAESAGLESGWVIDQLATGSGMPIIESTVALAAASAVTSRLRLGLGVLIVPLRPVAWIAKQVASLQHLSGGRLILGVGVGGDRHDTPWAALGVPRRERGARLDAALEVLPALIRGEPAITPDGDAGAEPIVLAPGAAMPPVVVGGGSPAAMRRVVREGAGWFPAVVTPEQVAAGLAELERLASAAGRPRPPVTAGVLIAMTEDPSLPDRAAIVERLGGPAFGLPAEVASTALVAGTREQVAERLIAYGDAGVGRVVASIPAGDWYRQVELLAGAATAASGGSAQVESSGNRVASATASMR